MGKQLIRAKHQWVHPETLSVSDVKKEGWVHCDSSLEAKVYLMLKKYFAGDIRKDYPLTLAPVTDSYNAPLIWKVDFCLISKRLRNEIYIEVKGDWILHDHTALSDLKKTLRMYESQYKDPSNLLIVTQKCLRIDSVFTTTACNDLISKLIDLESLCSLS